MINKFFVGKILLSLFKGFEIFLRSLASPKKRMLVKGLVCSRAAEAALGEGYWDDRAIIHATSLEKKKKVFVFKWTGED